MTTQKVTQAVQNPTSHQSKNKRKKNRKKNKKSAGNGLAAPIANSVEPNVTSHADDLPPPQKTDDHPPIDKESVPLSAVNLPVTSSFLSEISTELDLAFGSNSLIDEMDQANIFKPSDNNGAETTTADVPEKGEESEQGVTKDEESIKSNLVNPAEPVAMETAIVNNEEEEDEKDLIDTSQYSETSEHLSQQSTNDTEGELKSSEVPLAQKAQEFSPIVEDVSTTTSIPNTDEGNNEYIMPISSHISEEEKEEEEKEPKEERDRLPRNDPNVISAAEESFPEEQMDKNGGGLSDESKNKSSEFPLHVNSNDVSLPPTLDNIEENQLSYAVSSAINSVIASKSIDTESIVQKVVHDIEASGKVEPRSTMDDDVMQDKSGSRTVVSSNVYKNESSIEVGVEETVQCPEPAVGSTGQRMPSSMKILDTPKITSTNQQQQQQQQHKSTFAAALRRRNCIIL